MNGDDIRKSFLAFFEKRGHQIMPSASLLPIGDPTLLFTSAGMVPFKHFFMGQATPSNKRLTSSQKCFRTTDIGDVGDRKHFTFFEMLGNFSIGDYFKENAIEWAWEFVTQVFKLHKDKLYATIYCDDDEAFSIWNETIGLPPDRIYRYGKTDNWWIAGNEGPCGPCSEIHIDVEGLEGCSLDLIPGSTPDYSHGCHPNHDCLRFIELWNLVFMQFNQSSDGSLSPLPKPSVDTGMGLERASLIMQNKQDLYETDLLNPIVETVGMLCGEKYGHNQETDFSIRVITEHSRASSFLISDGVVPSNEGRGYVLRRLIRRSIRFGRKLGLTKPFMEQVAHPVIENFKTAYPQLNDNRNFILKTLRLEEERFQDLFARGISILQGTIEYRKRHSSNLSELINSLRSKDTSLKDTSEYLDKYDFLDFGQTTTPDEHIGNQIASESLSAHIGATLKIFRDHSGPKKPSASGLTKWTTQLSGKEIFILYDTYGFPAELTQEIALEHDLDVDLGGFEVELDNQRNLARSSSSFAHEQETSKVYQSIDIKNLELSGYETLSKNTSIIGIISNNTSVKHAVENEQVEIVLEDTTFYPQGGGQVGDSGYIRCPHGSIKIQDTQSPIAGLVLHKGFVKEGSISIGDEVEASVDTENRLGATRHHTTTHLLHAALRNILGPHVKQAGSLVSPNRLRFDFSHVDSLSQEELSSIQQLVNSKVLENLPVRKSETTYNQAIQDGALAFFGDKYGDLVRTVDIGNKESFSLEVCGGTHVDHTGEIGTVYILSEASIGGGMRRLEAVSGYAAENLFHEHTSILENISTKLKTPIADIMTRLESYMDETDQLKKRLNKTEKELLYQEARALIGKMQIIQNINVLSAKINATNIDAMREIGDWIRDKLGSVVLVLGSILDDQPRLLVMITPDLLDKGLHAGTIVKQAAKFIDGSGGGRPDIAQAGGKNANKLDDALMEATKFIRRETNH